jgi:hypothetical protein
VRSGNGVIGRGPALPIAAGVLLLAAGPVRQAIECAEDVPRRQQLKLLHVRVGGGAGNVGVGGPTRRPGVGGRTRDVGMGGWAMTVAPSAPTVAVRALGERG